MADPAQQRLSLPRVWAFSTLALPLAGVGLPLGVYLAPLYADEVGLGLGLTGLLFMLLRFWDIFTDPIMGFLVDRYKSPLGRIRHWLILSIPILGLGCFFIYMPPREGVGAWYFVFWMALFYMGFTLLQTSRSAWVPAIAVDYDDRSRFFLWTEIFSTLFMLLLVAVPLILSISGFDADRFQQVGAMGWLLIISLPIAILLACVFVPDPPLRGHDGTQASFAPKDIKKAISNPLLTRVMGMELFLGTAIAVTASNYLFVAEDVFEISDGAASLILFLFFLSSVVAMPPWVWLAKKMQKHTAFALITGLCVLGSISYYIAAQLSSTELFFATAIYNGAMFGAPIVLIRSMTADVIEHELMRTGENRSGLYFSLLTSSYKVGSSFALGVGYFLVERLAGYDPRADNTDGEIHGLLLIFCVLPAVLLAAAALTARGYNLTREMQADTSAKLDPRGPEIMD